MSVSKTKSPPPKKMGRPSLPADRLRSRIVPVRLTKTEYEQIGDVRGRQSISEWIRQTALESIRNGK